jgi:hypothetical protein
VIRKKSYGNELDMLGEFSNKKDDVINDYEHNTIGVFNQNDAMINDHEYDIVGEF